MSFLAGALVTVLSLGYQNEKPKSVSMYCDMPGTTGNAGIINVLLSSETFPVGSHIFTSYAPFGKEGVYDHFPFITGTVTMVTLGELCSHICNITAESPVAVPLS